MTQEELTENLELVAAVVKSVICESKLEPMSFKYELERCGCLMEARVHIQNSDISGTLVLSNKLAAKVSKILKTSEAINKRDQQIDKLSFQLAEANKKVMSFTDRMKRLHKLSNIKEEDQR